MSAGANPAFIATQIGHEIAEMIHTIYSTWIQELDGDQIDFLNQRIGGYAIAPIEQSDMASQLNFGDIL